MAVFEGEIVLVIVEVIFCVGVCVEVFGIVFVLVGLCWGRVVFVCVEVVITVTDILIVPVGVIVVKGVMVGVGVTLGDAPG